MAKVVQKRRKGTEHAPKIDHQVLSQFADRISEWHRRRGRDFEWRDAETCYERIIAELLLQRTQAPTVARFYPEFIYQYPSWESLAAAEEADLQELLKPIGLWRRRARTFVKLAKAVTQYGGQLPENREELESLPGISQYIASAVRLLCHGEKELLLDANAARVLERVFGKRRLADIRYDPYLQELGRLISHANEPISVNWGILDLAATICVRLTPRCHQCPLTEICGFAQTQATSAGY